MAAWPAHVNVQGNEVANGLRLEGMCGSLLWSRSQRQDSWRSESSAGLQGGFGEQEGLWEELALQPMNSNAHGLHAHDRPHSANDRFWRWYEGKEASGPGGKEQRDAPERPRELPKPWREGECYFSQGVKEQFLREMRDYVRGQLS